MTLAATAPPPATAEAPSAAPVPLHERLLWDAPAIASMTGLSVSTIGRLRAARQFPKPDVRAGRRILWRPETVRRWIERGGGRA